MFKRYEVGPLSFYAHIESRGDTCISRACVTGDIPRIDEHCAIGRYHKHTAKLEKKKTAKISFKRIAPEPWPGAIVLRKLWEQISDLSFTNMGSICPLNPFNSWEEPEHEVLIDSEEIFQGLKQKRGRIIKDCPPQSYVWVLSARNLLTGDSAAEGSELIGGYEKVFATKEAADNEFRGFLRELVNEAHPEDGMERDVDSILDDILDNGTKDGTGERYCYDGSTRSFEVSISKRMIEA